MHVHEIWGSRSDEDVSVSLMGSNAVFSPEDGGSM
jgi:hypothetical protein